jgi:ATPase involved in DNA replication initiation
MTIKLSVKIGVESVFGKEAALGRSVKKFLCQRYTDEKLKDIGGFFGVGESGVSQACRRVKDKIRKDKQLERKISKIEKKDKGVKNEDLTPMPPLNVGPPAWQEERKSLIMQKL